MRSAIAVVCCDYQVTGLYELKHEHHCRHSGARYNCTDTALEIRERA
jgi:hypothetical protein